MNIKELLNKSRSSLIERAEVARKFKLIPLNDDIVNEIKSLILSSTERNHELVLLISMLFAQPKWELLNSQNEHDFTESERSELNTFNSPLSLFETTSFNLQTAKRFYLLFSEPAVFYKTLSLINQEMRFIENIEESQENVLFTHQMLLIIGSLKQGTLLKLASKNDDYFNILRTFSHHSLKMFSAKTTIYKDACSDGTDKESVYCIVNKYIFPMLNKKDEALFNEISWQTFFDNKIKLRELTRELTLPLGVIFDKISCFNGSWHCSKEAIVRFFNELESEQIHWRYNERVFASKKFNAWVTDVKIQFGNVNNLLLSLQREVKKGKSTKSFKFFLEQATIFSQKLLTFYAQRFVETLALCTSSHQAIKDFTQYNKQCDPLLKGFLTQIRNVHKLDSRFNYEDLVEQVHHVRLLLLEAEK